MGELAMDEGCWLSDVRRSPSAIPRRLLQAGIRFAASLIVLAQLACGHTVDPDALWSDLWTQAAGPDEAVIVRPDTRRAANTARSEELPELDPGIGTVRDAPSDLGDARREASAAFEALQFRLIELVTRGRLHAVYANEKPAPDAATMSVHFIQIGAYRGPMQAENQIDVARRRFERLAGLPARVKKVDLAERGRFFRAHFGPVASVSAARSLCDTFKQSKESCVIVSERVAISNPAGPTSPAARPMGDLPPKLVQTASLLDGPRSDEPIRGRAELPVFTRPGLAALDD